MADMIPIPKPNQPEKPLIRSSEPQAVIRTSGTTKKSESKPVAKFKEPTFKDKLRKSFVKEDITTVRDYVLFDILIPNLKRGIVDMITGALGQALGVQIPRTTTFSRDTGVTRQYRTDYAANSRILRDPIRDRSEARYDRHNVRELMFYSEERALDVLTYLIDICDQKGRVSVFMFYDKANITNGNSYINKEWGWRNLDGVKVDEIEVGPEYLDDFPSGYAYIIDLPVPRPI